MQIVRAMSHTVDRVEPILKWPGGKRWAIPSLSEFMPSTFERYIEPFFGGGALFFSMKPRGAILADINQDLINFYKVLCEDHTSLIQHLRAHQANHNKDYYYKVRSKTFHSNAENAAKFLYLNRTCWNGLYRVNGKGEFNVPIGTKSTIISDSDNFSLLANILSSSNILCSDFAETIGQASSNDFIFVDPPYTVAHNQNNFIKYNRDLFSWSDQIRLFDSLHKALHRGAHVMITNADHPEVIKLFSKLGRYVQLTRHSVLSGKSSGRKITTEALFLWVTSVKVV